jgi:hypothetical protein
MDRRFLPVATSNPVVVRSLFGVGSMILGSGSFAFFGRRYQELEPHPWSFWAMAAGFAIIALAVWLGTAADTALRVGPAGIAEDRGELKRIAWWTLEKITYIEADHSLFVSGKDSSNESLNITIPVRAHAAAAAHALAEALRRRPEVVDVPADVQKEIGEPDPNAGTKIIDPLQLVGRKCFASGASITIETDARICPNCEAMYHRDHVPAACSACKKEIPASGGTPKGEA